MRRRRKRTSNRSISRIRGNNDIARGGTGVIEGIYSGVLVQVVFDNCAGTTKSGQGINEHKLSSHPSA
jgi:hypothetical protein